MNDLSAFFVLTMSVFVYDKNIDATRNSMVAYYKQSGFERNVKNYLDNNTDSVLRSRIGNLIFVTNIIAEKKLVYTETF